PERRIVLTVNEERILLPAGTTWEQARSVIDLLDGSEELDGRQYGRLDSEKVRGPLAPCALLLLDGRTIELPAPPAPEPAAALPQAPAAPSIPRRDSGAAVAFPQPAPA